MTLSVKRMTCGVVFDPFSVLCRNDQRLEGVAQDWSRQLWARLLIMGKGCVGGGRRTVCGIANSAGRSLFLWSASDRCTRAGKTRYAYQHDGGRSDTIIDDAQTRQGLGKRPQHKRRRDYDKAALHIWVVGIWTENTHWQRLEEEAGSAAVRRWCDLVWAKLTYTYRTDVTTAFSVPGNKICKVPAAMAVGVTNGLAGTRPVVPISPPL